MLFDLLDVIVDSEDLCQIGKEPMYPSEVRSWYIRSMKSCE